MLPVIISIVSILVATSVADTCNCDPTSLYQQYCCQDGNNGKIIKLKERGKINYAICPLKLSSSCVKYDDSCSAILFRTPSASSGYYNIQVANGSVVSVYCDMEGSRCDGEGGWTRVGYLNMTEPGAVCPQGLVQKNFSELPHDVCSKGITPSQECYLTTFDSYSLPYTKVCGQVRGYQFGHTDGLFDPSLSIDAGYVSGISITYSEGEQRQHIWTYASGENENDYREDDCPCNNGSTAIVPSFVGEDYYCESGFGYNQNSLSTDVLWDGKTCNYLENFCCNDSNLPWFYKELSVTTSSDIEVRVCCNDSGGEEVPVDIIELFVK